MDPAGYYTSFPTFEDFSAGDDPAAIHGRWSEGFNSHPAGLGPSWVKSRHIRFY
jgi:hypothetical protein